MLIRRNYTKGVKSLQTASVNNFNTPLYKVQASE